MRGRVCWWPCRSTPTALTITGDPVVLEDEPSSILDPAISWTAGWSVSVSASGSLGYYSAPSTNTIATWYDANGVPTGTLNLPPGHYESITISPDGTRGVAVQSTSPSESTLWLVDLARGGATPLSSGRGRNDSPVWSPDGTRVVWAADRDGAQNLFVKSVDEVAPEQVLFQSDVPFKNPVDWSRDGHWIVMTQLDQDTSQNVWLLDASGSKPPTAIVRGPRARQRQARCRQTVVGSRTHLKTAAGSRSTSSRSLHRAERCRFRRTVRCEPGGRATDGSSCCSAAIFGRSRAWISRRVPHWAWGRRASERRSRLRDCPPTSCGWTRCLTVSDSWRFRQNARAPGRSPSCRTGAQRSSRNAKQPPEFALP